MAAVTDDKAIIALTVKNVPRSPIFCRNGCVHFTVTTEPDDVLVHRAEIYQRIEREMDLVSEL